jgi:photosystem II stability/assembly factor-like uncharacterized protein
MSGGTPALLVAVRDALWIVRRDGGGSDGEWRAERLVTLESRLQSVAVDPARDGRVFCGTAADGLWRSDDLGRSWARVGEGTIHPRVTAVAVSPAGWGDDVVYAGTEPTGLFRSADGGESWEGCDELLALPSAPTWSFPPRPETSHVRWIAPDPLVPGRLFVAIEAGALVSSTDGGRSWTDRQPGGPYDTHTLIVHSSAPGRLYSAAGDGYFESRDGGATWQQPEEGLEHRYVWGLAVDPHDPETVVVSAARSAGAAHEAARAESWIYRRSGGGPWEAAMNGLPEPAGTTISVLAAGPRERGVVYAANNRGIYRSHDQGESWEDLGIAWPAGYERERVAGMAHT